MSETLHITTSTVVLAIEITCGLISTVKIGYELVELIDINKKMLSTKEETNNTIHDNKPNHNLFKKPFVIILLSAFFFFTILTLFDSEFIFRIISLIVFITVTLITIILGIIYMKLYSLNKTISNFIKENQQKIDNAHTGASLYIYNNFQ